jgi:transcriptional regulator with XRE-family HTH domain
MSAPQNIVGSRIKLLRREKGLTQAMLAARCGTLGWDIGENIVTKIETLVRCVTDAELLCLAKALNAEVSELLPSKERLKPTIVAFFAPRSAK